MKKLFRYRLIELIVASLLILCSSTSFAGGDSRSFKAAAVAFDPAWGDLEGNISRIVQAADEVAETGVKLMVFPEQATTGYIFDDFNMVRPFLDTIPGKATDALSKVTRARHVYVTVGIAEIDPASGLGFNSVALIGPEGYIGKYRKHGLNSQDQRWVSPGNLGFPVFDTELGRIMMLICYDDTYWQYGRLALLHDVDVIAWSSASDRVMPGSPKEAFKANHSTVANVQYLAKHSGAWVVAATRNGIETNPLTGQQLYYNGGSSIWTPAGDKIAQGDVVAPEKMDPGVHGVITATIDPGQGKATQVALLKQRRPELYGLLALHRSPTDQNASKKVRAPKIAAQAASADQPLAYKPPPPQGLLVLPALFMNGPGVQQPQPEAENGPSETFMSRLAQRGPGYVVGSYARQSGDKTYHTVSLVGPDGQVIARYDASHVLGTTPWANAGNSFVVADTAIGRIGLALADELSVPEVFGHLGAQRADIIAAPARQTPKTILQIDPKLFAVSHPQDTPYDPYIAAMLSQTWVVSSGWRGNTPDVWIFGPEPVIQTAPSRNAPGKNRVERQIKAPWPGTWINQQQLVAGQRPDTTVPLALGAKSACYLQWRQEPGWKNVCW